MKTCYLTPLCVCVLWTCSVLPVCAAPKALAEPARILCAEKGGDWKQARTWLGKKVPSGFESALIVKSARVTVNTPVAVVNCVHVGDMQPYHPLLVIEDGADLKVQKFFVLWTGGTNSTGAVELKGGSLTVDCADYPDGRLIIGTCMTFSGAETFTFSGGKFTGDIGIGTTIDYHTGRMVVVGAAPKIAAGKFGSNGFVLYPSGTLEFILEDKGVAPLEYGASRQVVLESGSKIVIDGRAYRGGSKALPLIIGPARKFVDNGARFSMVNFGPDVTATVSIEPYRKEKALVLKIKAEN